MKKVQFKTARVEYIIETHGYSRNGLYVKFDNLEIIQLSVGRSACFSYTIGNTPYRIETDPVVEVQSWPREYYSIANAYRVRVQSKQRTMVRYRIGSRQDVEKWAADKWPEHQIMLDPCRSGITQSEAINPAI